MDLFLINKTGMSRKVAVPAKGRPQSGASAVVLSHPHSAVRVGTKIERSRARARRWVLRELDCLLKLRRAAAIEKKTNR